MHPGWVSGQISLVWGVCVALFACVSTKLVLGMGALERPETAGAHEIDATRGREYLGLDTCSGVGAALGDR